MAPPAFDDVWRGKQRINLIDSPGQYIGGLGFFPQGFGTPIQPYGVTGARQD